MKLNDPNDCPPRATPRFSVIMPVYNGEAFIARALDSLFAQKLAAFELIIVDDGSRDATIERAGPWLDDPRVTLIRLPHNEGLGRALNTGLDRATAPLIAYLPADDIVYADHLEVLAAALDRAPDAIAAISGVRHSYNRMSETRPPGEAAQLVQTMHRATDLRWVERANLTTDDLDRMFWAWLGERGAIAETREVTCEWVDHPHQRHKIVREPIGGINPYRLHYGVTTPLIFHATTGHRIDEVARYAKQRAQPIEPRTDGLKIVLVGELAYNSERVLALAEAGHKLYGLWTPDAYWYNAVGPLPFGHVEELPADDWQAALARIEPDVIYALLNWQAIPFVHKVMRGNTGIPLVWHFKEGPFIALEHGMWAELADLHREAEACIYSSEEMRDWYATSVPETVGRPSLVLDGDLPKRDLLTAPRTPLLSASTGDIHTVVPGRPIGLHPECVEILGRAGIHLHFYGEFTHGQWKGWIERTKALAGRFIHLHPNVDQEDWVAEFSQYDAGWLHFFESRNAGEMRRANWDDLNIPARMATLGVCGVPMIQRDNSGHVVAMQSLARQLGTCIFGRDMHDVAAQLHDAARLSALRVRVWAQRDAFIFDTHVPRLADFLRSVAKARSVSEPVARVDVLP